MYLGDDGVMQNDIAPGQSVTTNVNGSTTFSALFSAIAKAKNALLANDRDALDASLGELQIMLRMGSPSCGRPMGRE